MPWSIGLSEEQVSALRESCQQARLRFGEDEPRITCYCEDSKKVANKAPDRALRSRPGSREHHRRLEASKAGRSTALKSEEFSANRPAEPTALARTET